MPVAVPPLLMYWAAPLSTVVEVVLPPETTVCVRPSRTVSFETLMPETSAYSSLAPLSSTSPLTVPPLITMSPPLRTLVLLAVPP